MNFASVRIITADIECLTRFYELITGVPAIMLTPEFGEFRLDGCTLAIGSTQTLRFFGGEIARPAANQSVIVEFRVDDVDSDYQRLSAAIEASLVQPPTTMPWGNRSLLFRDPDGNLVNFFTPMKSPAR